MRECIVIDCRITKITNYEGTVGIQEYTDYYNMPEECPKPRLPPSYGCYLVGYHSLQPTAL